MGTLTCNICEKDLCKPPESEQNTNDSQNNHTASPGASTKGSSKRRKKSLKDTIPTDSTDISCAPCGHLFHTKCLQSWLSVNSRKCSKCKHNFVATKLVKLFPSIDRSEERYVPLDSRTSIMDRITTFNPQPYEGDSYGELKQIHTSLMHDYEELQHNVHEQQYMMLIKHATLSSLLDTYNIMKHELQELKLSQIKEPEMKIVKKRGRLQS